MRMSMLFAVTRRMEVIKDDGKESDKEQKMVVESMRADLQTSGTCSCKMQSEKADARASQVDCRTTQAGTNRGKIAEKEAGRAGRGWESRDGEWWKGKEINTDRIGWTSGKEQSECTDAMLQSCKAASDAQSRGQRSRATREGGQRPR